LLEQSEYIDEIIILTNDDNDKKLKQTGYKTIIQDDHVVFDMFSGWEFIKKTTGTTKNSILMPSDNVSDVNIDKLISKLSDTQADLIFSLFEIRDIKKLSQMGTYDISKSQFKYKDPNPSSNYGVIAPFIVKNSVDASIGDDVFNMVRTGYVHHIGFWFDVGDYNSLIETANFLRNKN